MTNGALAAVTTPPPTAAVPGPDPTVSVAFAMGWHVAELYHDPRPVGTEPNSNDDLPGLDALTELEWTKLHLKQLDAGLHRLLDRATAAGLQMPDLQLVKRAFEGQRSDQPRAVLGTFHVELLKTLTAADFRLGKAYGLGNELVDACRARRVAELRGFFDRRLASLDLWIADLDSAFPAHAGKAVRLSMQVWDDWTRDEQRSKDDSGLESALEGQGRTWRALLSAEKAGTDTLHTKQYVDAVREMLRRASATLARFWWLVLLALILLGLSVVLLLQSDSTNGDILGVGALAASLGLTWKGVGTGMLGVAKRVEQPLWGAAVNLAIAFAITRLPTDPLPEGPFKKATTGVVGLQRRKRYAFLRQRAEQLGRTEL
jgi:hypothetical protein